MYNSGGDNSETGQSRHDRKMVWLSDFIVKLVAHLTNVDFRSIALIALKGKWTSSYSGSGRPSLDKNHASS